MSLEVALDKSICQKRNLTQMMCYKLPQLVLSPSLSLSLSLSPRLCHSLSLSLSLSISTSLSLSLSPSPSLSPALPSSLSVPPWGEEEQCPSLSSPPPRP